MKILPNVERSEALRLLDQEGTLLVLCSLVDNMPYVLAEAAVQLILPFTPFPLYSLQSRPQFTIRNPSLLLTLLQTVVSRRILNVCACTTMKALGVKLNAHVTSFSYLSTPQKSRYHSAVQCVLCVPPMRGTSAHSRRL